MVLIGIDPYPFDFNRPLKPETGWVFPASLQPQPAPAMVSGANKITYCSQWTWKGGTLVICKKAISKWVVPYQISCEGFLTQI